MKQRTLFRNSICCGVSALLLLVEEVQASGFEVNEKSAAISGMANAGDVVNIDNASVMFFNPAAITAIAGTQLTGGLAYGDITGRFSGSARNYAGQLVSGSDGGDFVDPIYIPNIAYSHQINENWFAGIGLSVPYGALVDYPEDFIGRYFANLTEFKVIDLQPTIAGRSDNGLSIGLAIHLMYAKGRLTKAMDFSDRNSVDGFMDASGDDIQVAGTFGLMYEFSENATLGFSYYSGADFELEGDVSMSNIPHPLTGELLSLNESAKVPINTPETLTFGGKYTLATPLEIYASVKWSRWSQFSSLDIISTASNAGQRGTLSSVGAAKFSGDSTVIGHITADFVDTWSYAIGLKYQLSDSVALKTGYAYDGSPIREGLRTTRLPSGDRNWFTLGAQWKPSQTLSFDITGGYLYMSDLQIADLERNMSGEPLKNEGVLNGKYDIDAWGAAFQVSRSF